MMEVIKYFAVFAYNIATPVDLAKVEFVFIHTKQ